MADDETRARETHGRDDGGDGGDDDDDDDDGLWRERPA